MISDNKILSGREQSLFNLISVLLKFCGDAIYLLLSYAGFEERTVPTILPYVCSGFNSPISPIFFFVIVPVKAVLSANIAKDCA